MQPSPRTRQTSSKKRWLGMIHCFLTRRPRRRIGFGPFELLCATNQHDSLPVAMSMASRAFPDDPQLQSWSLGVDRLLSLIQDSTSFEVKKLRPQSEAEEFSAFPYEQGLVYMSTGLNAGFLPTVDGWTGQYYTELCQIENLEVPFKRYTWLEQIRNQDVFSPLTTRGNTTVPWHLIEMRITPSSREIKRRWTPRVAC